MANSVPVMAYHCKLYAVQKGLTLTKGADSEQATNAKNYLMGELSDLEAMKQKMGDINKEDMLVAIENFVLSVFAAADKDERTCETVTKNQAIAFKRSGDFIQVLTCFGELSEEWEKRRKYCMYKAGTIMKALKAGEQPERGNPFEPETNQ
jgi:vacuolar protein sorting-associated protein VTA1